ncbi:MAG: ATP-binding protein [Muribaculaceae bacterium]|nr:ATP-binding protein [Muribaculaceae bacterium]
MFGKNGAGKSNFVKALSFFRHFVVYGRMRENAPRCWCRIEKENEHLPSEFEAEFIMNGKRMSYALGVVLAAGQIVSERLSLHKGGRRTNLFCREAGSAEFVFHSSAVGKHREIELLSKTFSVNESPLLFSLNFVAKKFMRENEGTEPLWLAFSWFAECLEIIFPDQPLAETSLLQGGQNERFEKLLREFDTGISKIKMESMSKEKMYSQLEPAIQLRLNSDMQNISRLQNVPRAQKSAVSWAVVIRNRFNFFAARLEKNGEFAFYTLKFIHDLNGRKVEFTMENESDGTYRLFQLLEILMTQKPKVFVIDEINRCLHPKLTVQFVKKYLECASAEGREVQLITTTHETRLMDHEIVRRDEIRLCDTAEDGSTKLYSLEDKQVRIDKVLEENYMNGVWGGVPKFAEARE